jgi:[acyl-carrier-protein] S-malonyltransferase
MNSALANETKSIAFLFPGQGSQSLGMGKELTKAFSTARDTFNEADQILGFSLSQIAWEGPEEQLNDTINTQPALLVHSVAVLRILQDIHPQIKPILVAGHSMGQITALVSARALSFPNALLLARRRGELMKRAGDNSPGGMAAILGLDIPTIEKICNDASTSDEVVQVANDNCPGQVVISGADKALERAIQASQIAGARRAIRLAVSIAAHSPLMKDAQDDFNQAVDQALLSDPQVPIVGNVSARLLTTAQQVRMDLQAQLNSRVRWTESIEFMISQGVTDFFELGNGTVLTGLLKRINRQVNSLAIGKPEDFENLSQF